MGNARRRKQEAVAQKQQPSPGRWQQKNAGGFQTEAFPGERGTVVTWGSARNGAGETGQKYMMKQIGTRSHELKSSHFFK